MTEIHDIKKRSVTGVIALTSRTAFLQVISVVGNFFLTIFLSPEEFGVYFIVTALVVFLNYFSDVGLAAALIQKKEITGKDLSSTFTIQQLFVVVLSVIALFFSSSVGAFYNLSGDGVFLFQALVVAFFLSSLKTIPSILLERKLEFKKLVIPQLFEVVAFYVVAVLLAARGQGIMSFSYAVIARGLVGLFVMYVIEPWKPMLSIDRSSARSLLSFGVPFQLNSFLALVKDDLFTLYLGRVLPLAYVGYIGWAKKWSELPLRLIMDSIVRVTFPTYARLQSEPERLSKGINKTIYFIMLFILPLSVGMLFVIDPFINIIPKYEKWAPALFSFYLFIVSSAVASLSTPLINALNAIGKIKVSLYFMTAWTILTWVLMPLFISLLGYEGFAIGSVIISCTVFAVVFVAKRFLSFSVREQVVPSLVSSMIMTIVLLIVRLSLGSTLVSFIALIILGGVSYVGSYLLLYRAKIQHEIGYILQLARS